MGKGNRETTSAASLDGRRCGGRRLLEVSGFDDRDLRRVDVPPHGGRNLLGRERGDFLLERAVPRERAVEKEVIRELSGDLLVREPVLQGAGNLFPVGGFELLRVLRGVDGERQEGARLFERARGELGTDAVGEPLLLADPGREERVAES